jgi:hypothetical protein
VSARLARFVITWTLHKTCNSLVRAWANSSLQRLLSDLIRSGCKVKVTIRNKIDQPKYIAYCAPPSSFVALLIRRGHSCSAFRPLCLVCAGNWQTASRTEHITQYIDQSVRCHPCVATIRRRSATAALRAAARGNPVGPDAPAA